MNGAREETWTARVTSVIAPAILAERGWRQFVEWSPDRKDPLHCLVAVLCVFPDKEKAAALLACGGVQEPLRTVLTAVSRGEDASACVVEAWEYASPEDKVGYDMGDVVSQLHALGTDAQDIEDRHVCAYVDALHRRVAVACGDMLIVAKQAQPDRVRMRIEQASTRLHRQLADVDAVKLAYADARHMVCTYDDDTDTEGYTIAGRYTDHE
jgi:hypothetical protein